MNSPDANKVASSLSELGEALAQLATQRADLAAEIVKLTQLTESARLTTQNADLVAEIEKITKLTSTAGLADQRADLAAEIAKLTQLTESARLTTQNADLVAEIEKITKLASTAGLADLTAEMEKLTKFTESARLLSEQQTPALQQFELSQRILEQINHDLNQNAQRLKFLDSQSLHVSIDALTRLAESTSSFCTIFPTIGDYAIHAYPADSIAQLWSDALSAAHSDFAHVLGDLDAATSK